MRKFGRLAFILFVLGITGCDHATKQLVVARLAAGQTLEVVSGVLEIRSAFNTDSAFSLLGNVMPLSPRLTLLRFAAWLGVIAVGAIAARRWKRAPGVERVAWALILGGALGNALDRLVRGHVVDFIYVHYWPVFNVADIAVTVGLCMILLFARKPIAHFR